MPEWLKNTDFTMSKKANAVSTPGRPLMGGKVDAMQRVPDFATTFDHYAKNKKAIRLEARYV